jgi:hypothetical protein
MTDATTHTSSPGWRALVAGGLACGVLDISAAFTNAWLGNGVMPVRVLKAVASGLLGADAFNGGAGTAAFGLALHFCVAFGWAAGFVLLARRFPGLRRRAVLAGLVYGAFVYVAMTYAVLPLAAHFRSLYIPTTKPFVPRWGWPQFGIHLVFVGLTISLAVKKFSRRRA